MIEKEHIQERAKRTVSLYSKEPPIVLGIAGWTSTRAEGKDFGQDLQAARRRMGMSRQTLADLFTRQVTPQSIYKWENNMVVPGTDRLIELNDILNLWDRLDFSQADQLNVKVCSPQKLSLVPTPDRQAVTPFKEVVFFKSQLRLPASDPTGEKLILLPIGDDSMEPTLRKGQLALVEEIRRGSYANLPDGLYVVEKAGTFAVKRLQFLADAVNVISDNGRYPPYQLKPEQLEVIGKVIGDCCLTMY